MEVKDRSQGRDHKRLPFMTSSFIMYKIDNNDSYMLHSPKWPCNTSLFDFFWEAPASVPLLFTLTALPTSVIIPTSVIVISVVVINTPPVVIASSVIVPPPVIVVVVIPSIPRLSSLLLPLSDCPLLLLFAQLLRILMPLPSQSDVVGTDGDDTGAEDIHREAFVTQLLLLVRAHFTLLDGVFARMVRLCVLVQAVGGSDGCDGRQTGRQSDVLPSVPLLLGFFRGRVVAQVLLFWFFGVVVAFLAAGEMAETFAVFLALVGSAAGGV